MLSPENYIKTKARALPIHEVLINEEWEATGIANIIITRLHPQGNITGGDFLVDLKCLGVKDANFFFNNSPSTYREKIDMIESQIGELLKIDYTLAHNIIYTALAFAAEFQIEPCKEFALLKYILEEDDEKIPLLDIVCGTNGIPHLIVTPARRYELKYLNNLKKYAGEGKYYFTNDIYEG